ncbi:MAG: hypothetical protein H7Z11_00755 [Verrucomicrobia bacterium]|nr:hypothetical protein [Leptolyngbya sp. ES-bin-22]
MNDSLTRFDCSYGDVEWGKEQEETKSDRRIQRATSLAFPIAMLAVQQDSPVY